MPPPQHQSSNNIQINDELLAKKLGLYYHPLFHTIVYEWASAFQANKNPLDIITFLEINVRTQQAILPHTDPDSSLASALHDWNREITNLSLSDSPTIPEQPDIELLKTLRKSLDDYPLELAYSTETYMSFFESQMERMRYSLVVDRLSLDGFAKFVFDLCYSWCGALDIELFSIFLIAVFYQTVQFKPLGYFQIKLFDDINSFPELLLTQIRLMKAHYVRYKKVDLVSYESWYEWNYLPHRLKEIKTKVIEVFCTVFSEDKHIGTYLEGLYWKSIKEITQKNLAKPSMTHFKIFAKENVEPTDIVISPKDVTNDQISMKSGAQKALLQLKSYNPMNKKTVPVLGRITPKNEQIEPEKTGSVRTLKSIEPFMGDLDPDSVMQDESLQKQMNLYPIWEREASEATTIATLVTRASVDKENMFKINKGVRRVPKEKVRHGSHGGTVKREYDEKIAKGNPTGRGFMTVENPYNSVGYVRGKGKVSISPRVMKPQIMSPTWAPKVYAETPLANKLIGSLFGEKESLKTNRSPVSLMKKRAGMTYSASTMSLWNETMEEVSGGHRKREVSDKKLLGLFGPTMEGVYRSQTGPRSRQKGRMSKEVSPELNRPYREEKVELSVVGKSRGQGNEEEILGSSREKYGLNLLAIEIDDGEKAREKMWSKSLKVDLSQRAQSTRGTRSPSREIGSPGVKQRTSRADKRGGFDPYMQMTIEIRKDSYSNVKLQFPSSVTASTSAIVSRRESKAVKQEGFVGKNLREMFDRMKDREEKNKRKQDIRMKRVKRPESKQRSQMTTQGMESRKESVVMETGKGLQEYLL